MLRLGGIALLVTVVLPALVAYAATFAVDPVINAEYVIPVEEVTTTSVGGPEPPTSAKVLEEPAFDTAVTDCSAARGAAAERDRCGEDAPAPLEELTAPPEPTLTPTPEPEAPDKRPTPYDANPAPFFSLDR